MIDMSWSLNLFSGMVLNGLFCADVLQSLDVAPSPSLTLSTNTTHMYELHRPQTFRRRKYSPVAK